jgi:hypothetical protein
MKRNLMTTDSMLGLVKAPEINRRGIDWLNVDAPIKISDLRGRLGVLAFWVSGSLPCLNTLSVLKSIADEFPDEASVVSIHAPTFPAEPASAQLLNIIDFHGITLPVAHDIKLELWTSYHIQTCPTLILTDPKGKIIGTLPGEPDPDKLIPGLARMILDWQASGLFGAGQA